MRAVVKSDGYGWGQKTVAVALEGSVQSYCVADAEELRALRAFTEAPAIVLGTVPLARFGEVLDAGGRPSVSNAQELAAAAQWFRAHSKPLRVRVGVRMAAAWSGLDPQNVAQFASELRAASAEVEAWTHITDVDDSDRQLGVFESALEELSRAGVRVTDTDICSTFPLARGIRRGSSVRIGVGLFGATGGPPVPGVACALRFSAPVLRVERHSAGTRIGYGGTMLGMDCRVAMLRCGFGDGLPASMEGKNGVLMAGMQYSAVRADALPAGAREYIWLDRQTSLDAFARAAERPVHEIVTELGSCARAALLEETP